MPQKENLIYKVAVELHKQYEIKARIGDGQIGDHNVFGDIILQHEPEDGEPEWKCNLGFGKNLKGKIIYILSATADTNPNTDYISSRVFINDEIIESLEGKYEILADDSAAIYFFNQEIHFV